MQEPVATINQQSKKVDHPKNIWLKARSLVSRRDRSSKKDVTSSPSNSDAQSDTTVATSKSTLTTPLSLPQSIQGEDIQMATNHQVSASKHLQDVATAMVKTKWLGQRKTFIAHLDNIQTSLNFVTDVVKLRALADIRKMLVAPVFNGSIPDDAKAAQDSLRRLHRALVELNKREKSSSKQRPLTLSIRIMKAAGYVQTKKKVQWDHEYLTLRQSSAVYPLQVDFANEKHSKMMLAETKLAAPTSTTKSNVPNMDFSLSQLLCDIDEASDYSFKAIGSILTPESSADIHELLQDISTFWTLQDTLEGLIKRTKKYRTFIKLAVQIGISYMHFASIATSHSYPRLSDYRYYSPVPGEGKDIGPEHVLMPFLSAGFGSKAPKKGTSEIGGFESQAILKDEMMTRLGLILHQVGCWSVFDEMDLVTARETAKSKRDDLMFSAGMPFAQIVDLCLDSKDGEFDPLAQSRRIYGIVIVPLQRIVDELRWD